MRRLALLIPINKDGKVLLQHRTKDAPIKPDHWAFFGGHIEKGENPETAARREFKEELQVEIERPTFFKHYFFDDEHGGGEKTFFVVNLNEDAETLKKTQLEGDNLGWFSYEEIKRLKKIGQGDFKVLQDFFTSKNEFIASI